MILKKIADKVLYIINIPAHIKRLYLRHKIKKHKEKEKQDKPQKNLQSGSSSLELFIFLLLFAAVVGIAYLNYEYYQGHLSTESAFYHEHLPLGSALVAGVLIFIGGMYYKEKANSNYDYGQLETIILQDEDGEAIKKWDVSDFTSLLIGKDTESSKVDIDLSSAVYSSLISRQHAVMNNTGDKWYFEDMDSVNGSGIKRRNSQEKFKVKAGKAYEVNSGDTIYIANTKLVLK